MSNKLLSLDISSKTTGYAVFDDLILAEYGSIDISSHKINDIIDNRTLHLYGIDIESLIKRINPTEMAVENIYIGENSRVGIELGMMSGIARYLGYIKTKQEIQTIYPAEVNSLLGMKRLKSAERKRQIVENINRMFNLSLLKKDHDVADAIGIGFVAAKKTFKNLKKKYI